MCACRQKKSFLIEDILSDTRKKPYKNLSNEPTKPLLCKKETKIEERATEDRGYDDKLTKFNVITEVQHEMDLSKVNLEVRRNTYPLYPTAMKPNYPWSYKEVGYLEPRQFSYFSDPVLNPSQMLQTRIAANRFVSHPISIRQAYGFDRGANCCSWWGLGGRRKGGQVRFTAAQTSTLERRFAASKYLSPDERRALASTLRLSDRQVKTWFQNRRAKWRRTTPDSCDEGSPPSTEESDDDVCVADDGPS